MKSNQIIVLFKTNKKPLRDSMGIAWRKESLKWGRSDRVGRRGGIE